MKKATYREIAQHIKNRTAYKGSSSHAVENPDGTYTVYSYSTPIAHYNKDVLDHTSQYRMNNTDYSQTTRRLQNIIKSAWLSNETGYGITFTYSPRDLLDPTFRQM